MPRDHLEAEVERIRAEIARLTLELVRLEAIREERARLQAAHEPRIMRGAMNLGERFWSKVDMSGGPDACWPWTASKNGPKGYGKLGKRADGVLKTVYAHRLVLEAKLGRPIADGMETMHACDNPACVNPAHLTEGTPSDNARDMRAKGRWTAAQQSEAQRKRRGAAVAAAKSAKSGSPIALAITGSQWRTLTAYAKRLKISQPTLSRYIQGVLECAPEVADQVQADFGLTDAVWPRPPRR